MLAILDSYFYLWMPILVVACAVNAVLSHLRGTRMEREFNDLANFRFRERGASGKRTKPFTLGGASRVLDVVVTAAHRDTPCGRACAALHMAARNH